MDQALTVALIRGDDRRGAFAQALSLLIAEVARCASPEVVILPTLPSPRGREVPTHAEALSATLDALLAADAERITVASAAQNAAEDFRRLGYTREAWGRPIEFLPLDRSREDWIPVSWTGADGSRRTARVAGAVASSECRVALATLSRSGTGLLRCLLGALHPEDRAAISSGPGDSAAALAGKVGPHLCLVDTFRRGEPGGGKRGRSKEVGAVVAGVDPAAVTAVATAALGTSAHPGWPGEVELGSITVLGDPIHPPRRGGIPRPHLPRIFGRERAGARRG